MPTAFWSSPLEFDVINMAVSAFFGGGRMLGWLDRVGGVWGGVDSLLIYGGLGGLHRGLGPFVSNLLWRPGAVFLCLGFGPVY